MRCTRHECVLITFGLVPIISSFRTSKCKRRRQSRKNKSKLECPMRQTMSHYFLAAGADGARTDSSCCFNC